MNRLFWHLGAGLLVLSAGCSRVGYEPLLIRDFEDGINGDESADGGGVDGKDEGMDAGDDGVADGGDAGPQLPAALTLTIDEFSTSSSDFVNVDSGTLDIPASPFRAWLVLFHARLWAHSGGGLAVEVRYLVDGVERGLGGAIHDTASSGGPWQHFVLLHGSDQVQTIQLQLRNDRGQEAILSDCTVVAVLLPPGAGPYYGERPLPEMFSGGFTQGLPMNFTTAEDGEYLLMVLANLSEAPSTNPASMRFSGPDGAYWPEIPAEDLGNRLWFTTDRAAWESNLLVRAVTLPAGQHQVWIEGASGIDGQLGYQRILVFRTDAFRSFQAVYDLPETSTSLATPLTKSTLTLEHSGPAQDYLCLYSLVARSSFLPDTSYQIEFRIDGGVVLSFSHSTDLSDSFQTSFGAAALVSTDRGLNLDTRFWSSDPAKTVSVRESTIFAIGL